MSIGTIYQLKVTLRDIRPPIWRRVLVPGSTRLNELHNTLQTAMGWSNTHLHEFEIDDVRYGVPDDDWGFENVADGSRVRLSKVAGERSKFRYTYDFGDNWRHDIVVEKVLEPEFGVGYPRCVAGKRAAPPEDVGGPWGYGEFLEAMGDPTHERHEELHEWIGQAWDPELFSVESVSEALALP